MLLQHRVQRSAADWWAEPQSESCDLDKVLKLYLHPLSSGPESGGSVHQYSLIYTLTPVLIWVRSSISRTDEWEHVEPVLSCGCVLVQPVPRWKQVSVLWDCWFSLSYWINRTLSVWFWCQNLQADHQEQNQLFTEHQHQLPWWWWVPHLLPVCWSFSPPVVRTRSCSWT